MAVDANAGPLGGGRDEGLVSSTSRTSGQPQVGAWFSPHHPSASLSPGMHLQPRGCCLTGNLPSAAIMLRQLDSCSMPSLCCGAHNPLLSNDCQFGTHVRTTMQARAAHASQPGAHQQGAAPAQLPRPPQLPRPAFTELPMHQHTAACPPAAMPPHGARSIAESQPGMHTQPLQQRQQQPMPQHLQSSQVKGSAVQSPTAQIAVHAVRPCQHGRQPWACSSCHQRLQQVPECPRTAFIPAAQSHLKY